MYVQLWLCLRLIINLISAGSRFSSRETVIDRRQRSKRSHVQFDTRSYVRRGWAFVWGMPTAGRSFSPIFSVPTIVPVCPSWNHLDPACQPRWRAQKLLNERWRHEPAAWKVCEPFLFVSTVFTPFRYSSRVTRRSTTTARFFAFVSESVSCRRESSDTTRLKGPGREITAHRRFH